MKKNAKLKKKITKYRPETQGGIFTMPYNYFYTNIFILKIEKKSNVISSKENIPRRRRRRAC